MSNILLYKVLNEYARKLQHFTHPAIEWDIQNKQFIYHTDLKKTLLWHFNLGFLLTFGTMGSSIFVLSSQIFQFADTIPTPVLVHVGVMLSIACLGSGIYFCILMYGKQFCHGWNQMIKIEEHLFQMGNWVTFQLKFIFI